MLSSLGTLDLLVRAQSLRPMPLFTTPVTSVSLFLMACPHDLGYSSQEAGPSQAPPCMGEGGHQDDTVKLSLQGQSWDNLKFWLPSLELKTRPSLTGAENPSTTFSINQRLIPLGGQTILSQRSSIRLCIRIHNSSKIILWLRVATT